MVAGLAQVRRGALVRSTSSAARARSRARGTDRRAARRLPGEVQPLVDDLNALLDHQERCGRPRGRQGRRSRARPEDAARRAGAGSGAASGGRPHRAGRRRSASRWSGCGGRSTITSRTRAPPPPARHPALAARSLASAQGADAHAAAAARRPRLAICRAHRRATTSCAVSARTSTRCSATCSTTPANGRARASRSPRRQKNGGVAIIVDDDGPGLRCGDARGGAAARRPRRRGRARFRVRPRNRARPRGVVRRVDRARAIRLLAASARSCSFRPPTARRPSARPMSVLLDGGIKRM